MRSLAGRLGRSRELAAQCLERAALRLREAHQVLVNLCSGHGCERYDRCPVAGPPQAQPLLFASRHSYHDLAVW